ncbi:MAG: hypothetical protein KKA60_10165 [Proteobacteria bacterium]|nr:hypothetical protein [Pseudomonadota bacterium]
MKKLVVLVMLLWAATALAGGTWMVRLKDGSVLKGEVEGLSGGVYLVRTPDMGLVRVPESRVISIQREAASPPSPSPSARPLASGPEAAAGAGEVAARMLSDQGIMDLVMDLRNDPAFQEILQDPKLMEAVANGNVAALLADPRFTRLLKHPQVHEIEGKLAP